MTRSTPPPFAAVYFDCDSTLATIEGVDELLRFADPSLRAEVLALTEAAMNGTMPLAEVYETRLRRLAPRREQLREVGELYVRALVPDAADTVRALQFLGKHVGIVSGGLLEPVRQLAEHLAVPAENVHAVPLRFGADGSYVDFDHDSPLWRNGGKIDVVRALPAAHRPLAFVGDGITDLETKDHVARFVGFGGVAARAAVRAGAEFFTDRPSLAATLPHLLTADECERLRSHADFSPLLSAAEA